MLEVFDEGVVCVGEMVLALLTSFKVFFFFCFLFPWAASSIILTISTRGAITEFGRECFLRSTPIQLRDP